jgi:hypothetical protein
MRERGVRSSLLQLFEYPLYVSVDTDVRLELGEGPLTTAFIKHFLSVPQTD